MLSSYGPANVRNKREEPALRSSEAEGSVHASAELTFKINLNSYLQMEMCTHLTIGFNS